ncbi:MAG: response regulator [Calditerrivibrio sp.]|nr:response regulator [Calditerrivibrio sp.]
MGSVLKFLIVEDNEADIELMSRELKKIFDHYEYKVCCDKNSFVELFKKFEPDLVITDYQISSEINGKDIIMLSKNLNPFVPVIIVSGSIGEELAVECLRLGAGDYVLKDRIKRLPFSVKDLIEKEKIRKENFELMENLKASNERYMTMFDNSRLPMLLIDPDDSLKILDVNKAAVNFYGYSKDEFKVLTIYDLVILPKEEVIDLAKIAKNDSQSFFDFQHRLKNGEMKYVNVYSGPIKFDDRVNLLSIVVDVTEKKRLEEKAKQLEERIHLMNRIESMGRLAGTIAHDFNNILTPIIAYSDVGCSITSEESELHNYFKQIKYAAEKGASLTRQILALGRKQVMMFKKIEIKKFIDENANLFRRLIREDIDFVLDVRDSQSIVNIDVGQITQVLVNLLVNAVDALKNAKEKKIVIEVDRFVVTEDIIDNYVDLSIGDYVRISVSDTGCGIPKEHMKNIFEPFFTTKLESGGSGLGLSICLGIIKQHKGDIKVYSEEGVGTTFKIFLPIVKTKVEDELSDNIGTNNTLRLNCNVLLVEDDLLVLEAVSKGLEKMGCRVLAVSDPAEAIDKVLNEGVNCDILVTDIIMPKYDGKQLYKLLSSIIKGLKVIFISGYSHAMLEDILDIEKGITFIQKPFDAKMLALKIKEVLG